MMKIVLLLLSAMLHADEWNPPGIELAGGFDMHDAIGAESASPGPGARAILKIWGAGHPKDADPGLENFVLHVEIAFNRVGDSFGVTYLDIDVRACQIGSNSSTGGGLTFVPVSVRSDPSAKLSWSLVIPVIPLPFPSAWFQHSRPLGRDSELTIRTTLDLVTMGIVTRLNEMGDGEQVGGWGPQLRTEMAARIAGKYRIILTQDFLGAIESVDEYDLSSRTTLGAAVDVARGTEAFLRGGYSVYFRNTEERPEERGQGWELLMGLRRRY